VDVSRQAPGSAFATTQKGNLTMKYCKRFRIEPGTKVDLGSIDAKEKALRAETAGKKQQKRN
jgi:hypothetical protein